MQRTKRGAAVVQDLYPYRSVWRAFRWRRKHFQAGTCVRRGPRVGHQNGHVRLLPTFSLTTIVGVFNSYAPVKCQI